MIVNDLVTKFSFSGSTAPLDKYNKNLAGSIKLLGGMTLAFNAAFASAVYWANGILGGVDALSKLQNETNVSVDRIQELSYAAGQSQSSADAMKSTISSLTDVIGTAAQKGNDDFSRLGISVRKASGDVKNADEVLTEVRHRFQELNLSMAEQRSFAKSLGIDSSLIQLLNKTDSQMAALSSRARQLGVLNKEQTKQAELYKKATNELWFGLNSIKQMIAIGLGPELENMAKSFTDLLAKNKGWIIGGIQFAVTWIGNIAAALNRLLPVFGLMAAGFIAMKIAALGFGGVMGIIFSPVNIIIAVLAAVLLAIDDLIVAFKGGKSVIADFFKNTFNIDIVKVLKDVWNFLSMIGEKIIQFGGYLAGLVGFGGGGTSIKPLQTVIPQGSTTNTTNASSVDNRQVTQTNTIEVKTSDPQMAGKAIEDTLQRQLRNANNQIGSGGR